MLIADPVVEWSTVLSVIWTSLVGGIGVTAAFALVIYGWTKAAERRRDGAAAAMGAYVVLTTLAGVVVVAAVVFGIVVMTHKS